MNRWLDTFFVRFSVVILIVIALCFTLFKGYWIFAIFVGILLPVSIYNLYRQYSKNVRRVNFMLNAIENDDFSFKFDTISPSETDQQVTASLNRIIEILKQTKLNIIQKEKYYELILNNVNTGIAVIDSKGFVFQANNEVLRLLGLNVFTHLHQLSRLDSAYPELFAMMLPDEKRQITFTNERDVVSLSVRTSEAVINGETLKIFAINDINHELDDKEIDSWIKLTKVLTHEIMNSVTPITSISETLLSHSKSDNKELLEGLGVIHDTGKGLISFIDSYRKFTHIPTPEPTLFDLSPFLCNCVQLAYNENNENAIKINLQVIPNDLILFADEHLIRQVMLNVLKNAVQAIGKQKNGKIEVLAFSNESGEIIIEITDNGEAIGHELANNIFVPFFSTKEEGSGVGLSISRQIMRLSGGNLTLKNRPEKGEKSFVLKFG